MTATIAQQETQHVAQTKTCTFCKRVLPIGPGGAFRPKPAGCQWRSHCRECEAWLRRTANQLVVWICVMDDCGNRVSKRGRRCKACATEATTAQRKAILAARNGTDIHGRPNKPPVGAKGDVEKCRAAAELRREASPERYMEVAKDAIWHLPYVCQGCKCYILMAGKCYACATGRAREMLRAEERNMLRNSVAAVAVA